METTLDLRIQQAAEEAVRRHLKGLESRQVRDAAVVVLDTRDASVLAWVGSPDWARPDGGQVNGPLARRSPGSALKPFLYGLGFERGWTAASVVPDVPTEVVTPTGLFRPENYDRHFRGPVSLREALAGSLNVPAVRLLDQLGGPEILQERLTRLGLATLDRSASDYGLGLVLGNAEVRLVDLTAAYATLGRLGVHRPWRVRLGALGVGIPVAQSGACWLVGDILRDPLARAPQFGLETPLRMSVPVAVKTGTSSGFRDNWAFGFTPEYTVGVWVGNFDGSPMRDVSGVDGAGPILNDIVTLLDRFLGTTVSPEPPGLRRWRVEPLSGHRVSVGRPGREEVFLEGTAPPIEQPGERDSRGRVVLWSD
jgi:penicillin-binding protein 1C